ncbi:MAG: DUF4197 family protein [Verrucomicrobia bacterium]|nr:DUF4197 family protein [Verrucomicrobiota bacterium]
MKSYLSLLAFCFCITRAVAADAALPTADEASKGLQTALTSLVSQAVKSVSDAKTADTLTITLPDKLNKLEAALRTAGQGQLMDDFKAKLKTVVAQTLPLTKDAFTGSTSGMKFDDALAVLKTGPDGLTNYTKEHTRSPIIGKVQPLIAAKSQEAGIVAAYQAMVAKAGPMASTMFGKTPPANLEESLTEQTVDFVYSQMGKGEGALRTNPKLSKDALVKKIFSAVKK